MKQVDDKKIYTVSEVNYFAKTTLEQMNLWVEGEISSFEENPAWFNSFLTLTDDGNILPCFIKPYLVEILKDPLVGKKVLVYGRLTLFRKNQYKMEIYSIEEAGEGILQKKFEKLYKKLKSEGIFDEKNKKPIPLYPKKICVVTSEGSAGWNDFKTHTIDKFPVIELYTADIRVEGPRAITQLLDVLPKIDNLGFDVIVITRGGGATETLLEVFNDEMVTRAIFNMKTPKIVAVGHEINVSLAELAADQRASTPTDAANIVASSYAVILEKLAHFHYRLNTSLYRIFSENGQILDSVYLRLNQVRTTFKDLPHRLQVVMESLKRHEKYLIADAKVTLGNLSKQLAKYWQDLMRNKAQTLEGLDKSLILLSPTNTLARGYAITTNAKGQVLKSIKSIVVGDLIGVKLSDGRINSKVLAKKLDD